MYIFFSIFNSWICSYGEFAIQSTWWVYMIFKNKRPKSLDFPKIFFFILQIVNLLVSSNLDQPRIDSQEHEADMAVNIFVILIIIFFMSCWVKTHSQLMCSATTSIKSYKFCFLLFLFKAPNGSPRPVGILKNIGPSPSPPGSVPGSAQISPRLKNIEEIGKKFENYWLSLTSVSYDLHIYH